MFVTNVLGALLEFFALYAFLNIFYKKEPLSDIFHIVCMITMPVLFFSFSHFVQNTYLRTILFIVCSIILSLGFRGNFWQRAGYVVLFQIALIFVEIGTAFLLYPLEGLSYTQFYIFANIVTKLVTCLLVLLLFLSIRKKHVLWHELPALDIWLLFLIPIFSLFSVSFLEYLVFRENQPLFYIIGFTLVLFSIALVGILYYLFYKLALGEVVESHLKILSSHLSRQKEYQKCSNHTDTKVRTMFHDMDRYLSIVYNMLLQNDINGALEFLQKKRLEIPTEHIFYTGYSPIDSVLNYKYQLAAQQNISIQLRWSITEPILVDITDLSVLLSNALDNALAACAHVAKAPYIVVEALPTDSYLKFCVINTTDTEPLIVNGMPITQNPDVVSHGLGMESMRMIAEKYNGAILSECKDHVFTLYILLENIPIVEDEKSVYKNHFNAL